MQSETVLVTVALVVLVLFLGTALCAVPVEGNVLELPAYRGAAVKISWASFALLSVALSTFALVRVAIGANVPLRTPHDKLGSRRASSALATRTSNFARPEGGTRAPGGALARPRVCA